MKNAAGQTVRTPNGLIIYDGPSLIDGKPIFVIANTFLKTENGKTGDVIQTWILTKDIPPIKAHKYGADFSVCGDCKHRHFGSCYVNLLYGPNGVYHAYHNGSYRTMTLDDLQFFKDKIVRLGSYGDPAAVPIHIWEGICSVAKGWTGYTHRWSKCDPTLKKFCMASVDSITGYYKEKDRAQRLGWRTFRIREESDTLLFDDEMACPASKELGHITDCQHCHACCGSESNRKNPVIMSHGWVGCRALYVRGMKKIKSKKSWKKVFPQMESVIPITETIATI